MTVFGSPEVEAHLELVARSLKREVDGLTSYGISPSVLAKIRYRIEEAYLSSVMTGVGAMLGYFAGLGAAAFGGARIFNLDLTAGPALWGGFIIVPLGMFILLKIVRPPMPGRSIILLAHTIDCLMDLGGKVVGIRKARRIRRLLHWYAWSITTDLQLLSNETRFGKATKLGQWICWAAGDMRDQSRRDDAIRACADVMVHLMSDHALATPSLPYPPTGATLVRLRRGQGVRDWLRRAIPIPVLVAAMGLIGSVLVLVTKLLYPGK